MILCTGVRGAWNSQPTCHILTWAGEPSWSNYSIASSDKPDDAAVCFSEGLSLRFLLKRKKEKKSPKRQSQIGVIQYDSEADAILVSAFPPSHSRTPLLTSNKAIPSVSFSNRWNFLLEAF